MPAQVLPRIRSPSVPGSGSDAVSRSLGETATPCTSTVSLRSIPSIFMVFKIVMNSAPKPYLKLTFLASIFCGIKITSSCSTFTHSTGPMPSGKSNISSSENGVVVYQPRPSSQTIGGFKHSSIVVQIENEGAKSNPSTLKFEPSKIVQESIRLNKCSLAYLAKTSLIPGSTPIPIKAKIFRSSQLKSRANCSSPSFTPVSVYG